MPCRQSSHHIGVTIQFLRPQKILSPLLGLFTPPTRGWRTGTLRSLLLYSQERGLGTQIFFRSEERDWSTLVLSIPSLISISSRNNWYPTSKDPSNLSDLVTYILPVFFSSCLVVTPLPYVFLLLTSSVRYGTHHCFYDLYTP